MRRHLRDPVNGGISFVGFLLTLLGVGWMLAQVQGQPLKTLALAVYGFGIGVTFLASALHHWIKAPPRIEFLLLQIDHAAIYLAIAGVYTPVSLFLLPEPGRTAILVLVWLFAAVGLIQKFCYFPVPASVDDPPDKIATGIYAVMGSLALFQVVPLFQAAGAVAFGLAAVGGMFYLGGACILTSRWLDFYPGKFGHHEIWHLCVLAGSVCIYGFLCQAVLPIAEVALLR